jgi:hypothetical protein
VVFYHGRFVALDSGASLGTSQAFVSTDGLNWTANSLPYGANQAINVSNDRLWVSGFTMQFVSGSLIWNGTDRPIVVGGTISGGHFNLSIDVPQSGNYRVYRSATANGANWEARELLNVTGHADWIDNDPMASAAFYMLKREP